MLGLTKEWLASSLHVYGPALLRQVKEQDGQLLHIYFVSKFELQYVKLKKMGGELPHFMSIFELQYVRLKKRILAFAFHVYFRAVLWQFKEKNVQLLRFASMFELCYGSVKKRMVSFFISYLCLSCIIVSQRKGWLGSSFHVYV